MDFRTLIQRALLKIGARASENTLHYVNGLLDYFELGWWLRNRNFIATTLVASSTAIFDLMGAEVALAPVLYLQFGVEDARIPARWSELLRNAASRLHIFDPVDGRGDVWLPARGRGHFWTYPATTESKAGAATRQLVEADPRMRYFAGDFRSVPSAYEPRERETVVAIFDTDLYSSTRLALDLVGENLPVGSFLFFDQVNHRADELRAFHEFLLESEAEFELFAANHVMSCAAFRRTN